MKTLKLKLVAFVGMALISIGVNAQQRTYLSGEDASTAINWDFKIDKGRNSGFWTTIPVPSNWEMEGFGFYLYGMDKVEQRITSIGNYRHEFDFKKTSNNSLLLTLI